MKILRKTYLVAINGLFWAFFVLSSMVLVIGSALIRVLTKPFDANLRFLQQYTCFWSSLYLWVNPFWSLKKAGLDRVDPKKAYVIVANHQSMADIICVFNTFLHFKWVAKKELFKVPLLGWNMSLNGYVAIDRGNPDSRERCLAECRTWLEKGSSVFFFPEGTRSQDGQLRDFKPGAFRLALESGFDILPIVIRDSLHAIPKHSRLLSGKSKMRLEILDPVAVGPYKNGDVDASARRLSDEIRARIQNALSSRTE